MTRCFLPLLALALPVLLFAQGMRVQPEIVLVNNVGMLSLEATVKALGGEYTLDAATKTATVTLNDKTFTCTVGKTTAQANGAAVTLPLAPVEEPSAVFAPSGPLFTALDCAVGGVDTAHGKLPVTLPGKRPRQVTIALPESIQLNNVMLLPLASTVGALGGAYTFDAATKIATVTLNGKTFTCTVGETAATANGTAITLPQIPLERPSVILVPSGPLFAALGCLVGQTAEMVRGQMPVTDKVILPALPEIVVLDKTGVIALEPLAEALGGTYTLDTATKTATVTIEGKSFVCTVDQTAAKANDTAITLPIAPLVRSRGVVYAPSGPLFEALGFSVGRPDMTSGLIAVTMPGMDKPLQFRFFSSRLPMSAIRFRDTDPELFVVNIDGTGLRRLTYNSLSEVNAFIASDGSTLAYASGSDIIVRKASNSQENLLAQGTSDQSLRYFLSDISPDGTGLLYTEINTPYPMENPGYNTVTSRYQRLDNTNSATIASFFATMRFSPDGKAIGAAYADQQNEAYYLRVMKTEEATEANETLSRNGEANPLPGPDGKVLVCESPANLVIYTIEEGKIVKAVTKRKDEPAVKESQASFNSDGTKIVFVRPDGIYISDLERTVVTKIFDSRMVSNATPAFADNDTKIVLNLGSGGLCTLDAESNNPKQTPVPLVKEMRITHFRIAGQANQVIFVAAPLQ